MNKTALKNFATWSRRKLIEQVQTKALLYGIDEKNGLHIEEQFGQLLINGEKYPLSMKGAFKALQKQLEQKGYKQLLEEAAYTWFNRIIAIRYMEVHEYLPERVNVLSSSVGRVDPDILFEYDTMDLGINHEEVRELINTGNTEAAYRLLFVAQCNALNPILPFMFEKIQDYTELLLPDFLLDAESVIKTLVHSEELTESFAEIEVIGWLYQYYIAEEKDRVFAQKSKYKKEEIPFATQLFTPKWIVQYMVQNSLGRYWTEAHREDEDLIDNWEYFIKHEEEDFREKIAPYVNKELKVEDIKLLDPAMGSGHILVYAFEVFYEIYEKCGYPERDIPRLILENNLYGLDIDDRAYLLSAFAIVMKAASRSKRFLRSLERKGIQLNLASIQETNHITDELISYIAQQEVGEQYNSVKAFFDQYHNAKTYGSLINITEREITFIEERLEQIENNPVEDLFYVEQHEIAKQVMPVLIHQTKIMRNEYDVVVMNPPYLGFVSMGEELSKFIKKNYEIGKSDLYAAFMLQNSYLKKKGLFAAINQQSWMFTISYKDLRKYIIENKTIDTMIHLGTRAFEEIGGEKVQSTMFVLRNYNIRNLLGIYIKLVDYKNHSDKQAAALRIIKDKNNVKKFELDQLVLKEIIGWPIAFWASDTVRELFKKHQLLTSHGETREGLTTGNNEKFLRLWYEVDFSRTSMHSSPNKYYPLMKGGTYRKWYGNLEYVVDWENEGFEIRNYKGNGKKIKSHNYNLDYIFEEGVTWTRVTSLNTMAFRYMEKGFIFDTTGASLFTYKNNEINVKYILGLLNSKLSKLFIPILNPTMALQVGSVAKIPLIIKQEKEIVDLVEEIIEIHKKDWNSNEISWEFKKHPLINYDSDKLKLRVEMFLKDQKDSIKKVIEIESLINEKFINSYGLEKELTSEISETEVTLNSDNQKKIVIKFISYFIGCLFGRFKSGLQNEGQNVINFSEKKYFDNDIIFKLRDFLSIVCSKDTIDENMQWLAEVLEMKDGEDAESRIRRYFLDEFFTDHCKMYQKRPIYWLVDSGKQKGLRTLIYMHHYQPDTMATIRFEHLQEIQAKYQQEIADLENRLVNPNLSATDKKKLNAEKVSFEKKIDELREFDKRLAAIAAEEIKIDLDDGVKVNYEKFYRGGKGVLAKI
ncbi:BREX-1 system adenine-specific DNA-methyltransferase PglX [Paenibacillus sp. FSL R10-2796]|uniref:BREX-1 system adenine-specific DNA-methyltransferase PglX n=1 Tax=Paenibacillus sp. FSL R10-2796 TaxID=2954663 RepID=UPI0030D70A83